MVKKRFFGFAFFLGAFMLVFVITGCGTITFASATPQISSAPGQKVAFNGHHYQALEASMSWTQAKAQCESFGGHLATVTSEAEQKFIEDLISKGRQNYYWLGGYCEADRKFKWVTDEPMSFTAWAPGEPNNYRGIQDKIIIYRLPNPARNGSQYRWDDISNEGTVAGESFFSVGNFGYICEWDN